MAGMQIVQQRFLDKLKKLKIGEAVFSLEMRTPEPYKFRLLSGQVAERLNVPHSKCGMGASPSGVRIPPCPPLFGALEAQYLRLWQS